MNRLRQNYTRIFFVTVFIMLSANLRAENIKVSAATNIQNPLIEITKIFMAKTGIHVNLIFAASGKITAQVINGAPYDLFISADNKFPLSLYSKKLAQVPRVYARGTLIVWTTRPVNLDSKLDTLKHSEIIKISIANPDLAPYGKASLQAIRNTTFAGDILKKLVYAESISQSNQYIQTGTVEAGFTSYSSVLDPDIKNPGRYWVVDENLYSPIEQSVCILEYGLKHHPRGSQTYFDFLFSIEAKKIFAKYGYKI